MTANLVDARLDTVEIRIAQFLARWGRPEARPAMRAELEEIVGRLYDELAITAGAVAPSPKT